ncbi:MAG: GntR family transcriptional regulator [Acidocella sp. 20-63-7]|nr:MAG: GntR family transcriptional regulator [Acidocella sp. 20-63-7]
MEKLARTAVALDTRRTGRHAVTLAEVAARAGVAPITVSRALNKPEAVSTPLRARIREAVEALGYVPNHMAGALASARTKVIPVIVPSLSNVVFVEVIEGIQDTLGAAGYQMLLGSTDYDLEREADLVATLLGWAPPGVLIAGLRHRPRAVTLLKNSGLPVVEIMEYGKACIDMNVGLSHFRAGAEMANHLLARGCRRIGFVGARMRADYRARQRYDGMRRRLLEAGGVQDYLFEYPQGQGQQIGWQALADVLDVQPRIDALFFANDEMAVGACLRAQRDGIAIPGRVAIAGFNGLPMSALTTPALTTMISPRKLIGAKAAELLLARVAGQIVPQRRIDVGFELAVRSST